MSRAFPFPCLALLTLGFAVLGASGCHSNQQAADNSNQTQNGQQQDAADPAAANVAPVASGGTEGPPAQEAEDQGYSQQASGQPSQDDTADEAEYGIPPEDTASQPPPPLPDYDQPPCPGDGYIWAPGYWYYAPAGYYWVPGAWVQAPYVGALWTPGYWAFAHGRYNYFHGYWGPHVGFYGGINYGFGYTGFGYQGGYWHGNTFDYNRTVNNINVDAVHNYYSYRIRQNNTTRVSFNGPEGVQVRPRLAELAALREPHAPPMNTQVQLRRQAMANHAQFVQANHGRPAQAAFTRPVAAQSGVHPVSQPVRNLPAAARSAPEAARNGRPANPPRTANEPQNHAVQINRTAPPRTQEHQPEPVYPETNRAQQKYAQPMHSQAKPGEPTRPQSNMESPRREQPRQQTERPQPQPMHTEPGRAVTARPEPQRAAPARPEPQHAAPAQPRRAEPSRPAQSHPQAQEKRPAPDHREEHK